MRYTSRTIKVSIPYIQEAMASKEEFDALAFCLFVKLSITSSEIQNATVRRLKELTHMGSDRLKRIIDYCVEHGFIMSFKPTNNEECAEWWVLAIITNTQDVEILASWLPDFDEKRNTIKKRNNVK